MDAADLLANRRIVLGVSGGIAAYKAIELCRHLMDAGAYVMPVLTTDAQRFIGAATFSALASEPARTSLFDGPEPIPHTRLGQSADVVVVAPATAKLIGKYAQGISDDLLTATLLATRAPVVVAPAMHTEMWEHAAVQANLATLRDRSVSVVAPESGRLAGGDVGAGRLATTDAIVAAVADALAAGRDLAGVRILITAGGTREPLDPVRFLGNRSSGKQGHALATAAALRGAQVTLVTTAELEAPGCTIIPVETAASMEAAVLERCADADVVIMAAAVADFRPKAAAPDKLKNRDGVPDLILEPTPDILAGVGSRRRPDQCIVGFAAETEELLANAQAKLAAKRCDLIVANDVSEPDSGFAVETNRVMLLEAGGPVERWPLLAKSEVANRLLDRIVEWRQRLG
jgi:phosphopantothenoylcysteine decarboxylase/phosphopantothenate--cysteine ligase